MSCLHVNEILCALGPSEQPGHATCDGGWWCSRPREAGIFFGGGGLRTSAHKDTHPMSSLRERVEAALAGEEAAAPPPRWAREWREDKPLPAPPALELAHEPYPYQRQAAHLLDSTMRERSLGNLLVASPTGSARGERAPRARFRAVPPRLPSARRPRGAGGRWGFPRRGCRAPVKPR